MSSFLIRSSIGLSFGVVFSVLLFKRRAWPAWVGLGFGAGRAWEEADGMCLCYESWDWTANSRTLTLAVIQLRLKGEAHQWGEMG